MTSKSSSYNSLSDIEGKNIYIFNDDKTEELERELSKKVTNYKLVDVDDLTASLAYQNNHVNQEYAEDLTSKFLSEVKGKPYTLKR